MKFSAILAFVTVWMFVVYFPLAHMVWGSSGLMNGVWNGDAKIPAIDFAGGTVVHMSSGWSALILCLILGKRVGFGRDKMAPHSMVLCMVGTGMLWVGWYGFNAGSAVAADGVAANAFMTTTLATAVAAFTWGAIERIFRGHASILGFCSGAVAGLVVITPACGFVGPMGALVIGLLAGIICLWGVNGLKRMIGADDSLDVFGVHGVGGILGALLTGVFAAPQLGGQGIFDYVTNKMSADSYSIGSQVWIQAQAIGTTIIWSAVVSLIAYKLVDLVVGLRVPEEEEREGLDITSHGESAYHA